MNTVAKIFESKKFTYSSFSTLNASGTNEEFIKNLRVQVGTTNASELIFFVNFFLKLNLEK